MVVNQGLLGLTVFRNLEKDILVKCMIEIESKLQHLEHHSDLAIKDTLPELLQDISYRLLDYYVNHSPVLQDGWQDYLLDLILADENPFSLQAQKFPLAQLGHSYLLGAESDLSKLQQLFMLSWCKVETQTKSIDHQNKEDERIINIIAVNCWNQLGNQPITVDNQLVQAKNKIKQLFLTSSNWPQLIPLLADFYYTYGTGIIGEYWAFRLDFFSSQPLIGISNPDPIRLSQLVGYENAKEQLINNTAKFVAGLPANNVLLYGDRGTGKSSSVKALLHQFGPKGLRMIELSKSQLPNLPKLIALIKNIPKKFIVFIDDLSFEDSETEYKEMKAVLEGSLEVKPNNILIYATSNRRHLIREKYSDRQSDNYDGEVRSSDTLQEKLSLSDRFGITLVFPSTSQQEYLTIVQSLVKERSIVIDEQELERLALQWELWHNGRSGRTAKQFVDNLEGDLRFKLHQA